MTERSSSRRAFLCGIATVGASAATSKSASAQESIHINDPSVVQEIEALFANYDLALRSNNAAALNGYFLDSPFTTRFGNRENLYGIAEIKIGGIHFSMGVLAIQIIWRTTVSRSSSRRC